MKWKQTPPAPQHALALHAPAFRSGTHDPRKCGSPSSLVSLPRSLSPFPAAFLYPGIWPGQGCEGNLINSRPPHGSRIAAPRRLFQAAAFLGEKAWGLSLATTLIATTRSRSG